MTTPQPSTSNGENRAALIADMIGVVLRESPDHIALIGRDLCYVYVNEAGLRAVSMSAGQVIGKHVREVSPSEVTETLVREFNFVFENGGSMIRESNHETPEGVRHFEYVLAPVRGEDGTITHIISTTRDTTAKTLIYEALQLRDRAISVASGGIVMSDPNLPDCPIVYVNQGFERMTGYASAEVVGRNCRFLQGPDTRREEVDKIRACVQAESPCTNILKNYRKDGTTFWNELTISPVHDNNGKLVHYLGVQNDISERVQVQEDLARALQREQRIASTLQRSLLLTPPETFAGLNVATIYAPAWDEAMIGGDFYDALALPDGNIALVVGDASGKGLDAAARTIEVKFALRVYLRENSDPARALARLNDFVCDSQRLEEAVSEMIWPFISMAICVVDPNTDTATFATAGAEPPFLIVPASSAQTEQSAHVVRAAGLPLGIMASQEYETTTIPIRERDTLVLTTDGVTEARHRGEMFGDARMMQVAYDALRELREQTSDPHLSPMELKAVGWRIVEAAREFAQGKLKDDVCLLVAHRTSLSEPTVN